MSGGSENYTAASVVRSSAENLCMFFQQVFRFSKSEAKSN